MTPERFARTIAYTPEALDQVVIDAYQTVLDRDPSDGDKAFWRVRLRRTGYHGLLADLSASDEFWAAAGRTRAGFVTRVYDRLLQLPVRDRHGIDKAHARRAADIEKQRDIRMAAPPAGAIPKTGRSGGDSPRVEGRGSRGGPSPLEVDERLLPGLPATGGVARAGGP